MKRRPGVPSPWQSRASLPGWKRVHQLDELSGGRAAGVVGARTGSAVAPKLIFGRTVSSDPTEPRMSWWQNLAWAAAAGDDRSGGGI